METFTQFLTDNHDIDTLVELWNEYSLDEGDPSDVIYSSIEETADLFESPLEMARALFFGSLDNWEDRVAIDVYGNLRSVWCIEESPIDIDALGKWLITSNHPAYELYLAEYAPAEDDE